MIGLGLALPLIARLGASLRGIPFRIVIGGLVYERVKENGIFVTEQGAPVYERVG
ncbi:hypothetical protein GGQ86_000358 [Xanthobacter flavus]|uniref:Uncharacterized protein n=1 Tax=Xanthobacter flavus TaxID=281 RepID=A0A9W6CST3_XANFL|nr:hypothetical protein [Xanthobacter flavus]MDR6331911.1 hypothetical protein [Xanthobacter flavus]GLI25677.1 hypothetical protein XFLAVUS301_53510 [Xanthobacter flavus]